MNSAVTCGICPHFCEIPVGGTGFCGARRNMGGVIVCANYGRVSGTALDPIEKKPLRMYRQGWSLPNPNFTDLEAARPCVLGEMVLSIGSFGCNLRCPFCQNCEISLEYNGRDFTETTPAQIASLALSLVPRGNIGVAYTYNEPLIGYEFVLDCAKAVRTAGLGNIIVTNGYINPEPLKALLPFIDAMNIDLKGFTDDFYGKLGGKLEPVKTAIELAARRCHIEVTTLVIPGENDSHIEEAAKWLAAIDPNIPLHLSRFFPRYKYSHLQPTPPELIIELGEKARKHLNYVFAGNM